MAVKSSSPEGYSLTMRIEPVERADAPMLNFTLTAPDARKIHLGWINPPHFAMRMELSLNAGEHTNLRDVQLFLGEADSQFFAISPASVGLRVNSLPDPVEFPSGEFWLAHDIAIGRR
jgi:hypothetical protein